MTWKMGDMVRVKDGFIDEETDHDKYLNKINSTFLFATSAVYTIFLAEKCINDFVRGLMSGWQGRIKEFYTDAGTALIEFDSLTIKAMPSAYIRRCEEEGYSWNEYGFELEWLEAARPRDSQHDVAAMINDRSGEFRYAHLGEEGRAMDEILDDADPDDEVEAFQVWAEHLSKHLTFPFAAAVSEFQERGPLQAGDHVKIHSIETVDDFYGVIVQVRCSRNVSYFPLCNLKVLDPSSPNHDLVQLYAVWFANR